MILREAQGPWEFRIYMTDDDPAMLRALGIDPVRAPSNDGTITINARLIIAAPILLAAAERMRPADGCITDEMPDDEVINLVTTVGAARQLMAAIAKATGAT